MSIHDGSTLRLSTPLMGGMTRLAECRWAIDQQPVWFTNVPLAVAVDGDAVAQRFSGLAPGGFLGPAPTIRTVEAWMADQVRHDGKVGIKAA
ncbi:MAG TPA: hypothetical protein VFG62_26160 [Rhodopila sp.]|nr:hypothetical protein [Rhodopila sp.]